MRAASPGGKHQSQPIPRERHLAFEHLERRLLLAAKFPDAVITAPDFLRDIEDGTSTLTALDLNVVVKHGGNHYQYKMGPMATTICSDAQGYSDNIPKGDALIEDLSGYPDGLDLAICLVGVKIKNDVVTSMQPYSTASFYQWQKTSEQPTDPPEAIVIDQGFLDDIADEVSQRQQLDLAIGGRNGANYYSFKVGEAATTSCESLSDYSAFEPNAQNLVADISVFEDTDLRLCLLGAEVFEGIVVDQQDPSQATIYEWVKDTPDTIPPGDFAILGPTGMLNIATPTITWEAAEGADFYDMLISTNSSCSAPVQSFSDLTQTSLILPEALITGTYYSCVTARDIAGNTTAATNNGLQFYVDVDPPEPFSILSPSGTVQISSPKVEWEEAVGAMAYDLVVSTLSDCSIPTTEMTDLGVTFFRLPTLEDGTYYTCITARDFLGNETPASNNGLMFTIETNPAVYHEIFATADVFSISSDTSVPPVGGTFGGLNAADWQCTFSAYMAGKVPTWNGVDLVYKAVLSLDGTNARDRFTLNGPLYNTVGELISMGSGDLWDGSLANDVGYDQYGSPVSGDVWSGTTPSGFWGGSSCGNWDYPDSGVLGTIGNSTVNYSAWISGGTKDCEDVARLYCMSPPIESQVVAGGASTCAAQGSAVTAADTQGLLDTALAYWNAESLPDIGVSVVDLAGPQLARTYRGRTDLLLDPTAAGYGWTLEGPTAPGTVNLLSTLTHEVGHMLGYGHTQTGVMAAELAPATGPLTYTSPSGSLLDAPWDDDLLSDEAPLARPLEQVQEPLLVGAPIEIQSVEPTVTARGVALDDLLGDKAWDLDDDLLEVLVAEQVR